MSSTHQIEFGRLVNVLGYHLPLIVNLPQTSLSHDVPLFLSLFQVYLHSPIHILLLPEAQQPLMSLPQWVMHITVDVPEDLTVNLFRDFHTIFDHLLNDHLHLLSYDLLYLPWSLQSHLLQQLIHRFAVLGLLEFGFQHQILREFTLHQMNAFPLV